MLVRFLRFAELVPFCNMAAPQLKYGILVILLAVLAKADFHENIGEELLYEEDDTGRVVLDLFDEIPTMSNVAPVIGTFNPSYRLASCKDLGDGTFPVFGNCSRYLECKKVDVGFIRRIYECPLGLWFSAEFGGCGLRQSEACPYGRLVPNPIVPSTENGISNRQKRQVPGTSAQTCTTPGQFSLPGCRGYYSCVRDPAGNLNLYTYLCAEGTRWDQNPSNDFCIPENQVTCDIPDEGTECLRECVAGDVRTCRYTFIVEEYASMSIYCKRCPFIASDCDLPNCIPGGGVSKPVVSINRRVPGPTIQACRGDTLDIEVQNRLPAGSLTIHWHGLHQRATPHMDGVPYVTQCPIFPGTSFRYRMNADMSGTHMYHSHIGHQETDGLFGAMIIREPRSQEFGINSRYDEDLPEHRMLIWHWYKRDGEVESVDTRLQSLRREGYGFIINGKGAVQNYYDPNNGNRVTTPVEEYRVRSGRRYRFRSILNTALNCPVQVSIDRHRLDIIAVDGRPVNHSGYVDSFVLSAGERVDFVPSAMNFNPFNTSFYIRVRGLNFCDDLRNGVHQHAILRYDNSVGEVQGVGPSYTNAIRAGTAFNLNRMISTNNYYIQARDIRTVRDANPLIDPIISRTPQRTFYVEARFNPYMDSENIRVVYPQLNDMSWHPPSFPMLTQGDHILPTTFCRPGAPRNCVNGLCRCTQVLEANLNELVEVVLVDGVGGLIGHPFHLHGYAFRVVAMSAPGNGSATMTVAQVRAQNEAGLIPKTYDGPLKDTVIVPGRGYVIIRFHANNPGYWLFHCHISEHMAMGMALVFKIGLQGEMVRPPTNFPRCGNFL